MSAVPNSSLDTGLAALKQGNYLDAITHLKAVCETELDESMVTRASQGLVLAYRKSGDTQKAVALCQDLTHHSNPKIREWATSILADLNGTASGTPIKSSAAKSTGFTPLESNPPTPSASDASGFAAFNPTPSHPKTAQRVTPTQNAKQSVGVTADSRQTQGQPTSTTATGQRSTNLTPSQGSVDSEATAEDSALLPPSSNTPPSTPVSSVFPSRPSWRNSGRAQKWSPLKPLNLKRLWLVELVSAITLIGVVYFFLRVALQMTNAILVKLPFLAPIQLFYRDPAPTVGFSFLILLLASPWLLDVLLKHVHGLQAFPLTQLTARSPEAAKVVQRLCRQRKLPVPKLGILPTNAPVILTYGNLPRTARIVVSEGLLAQLTDDEVATLYTGQLGHIAHWDIVLMSLGVLLVQIPYTIYWQVAQWGEQLTNLVEHKLPSYRRFLPAIIRGITGVIASISYAIYWLFCLPLLWLSRARLYYSDRLAIETTGNPNGLTRALLKMALGMAEEIQHDRQTSGLLEGFDLLLPVGYRQALILGSCSPQISLESLLQWDCTNPYRGWLIVSASHPLLGERVAMLCRNAQFWKIDPELSLPATAPPVRSNGARLSKLFNSPKAFPLLQSAVFFGLLLGLVLRGLLWVVGQIGDKLNVWQIIWMHNASPFLDACILIAFSLSLFLWINPYFPDIKPATGQAEPNLGTLLSNPATLPPDSQPVQLTGQLLGRQGLLNGLGQDLILQTSTGLVKLHFSSFLGPLGNLLPRRHHPSHLINQQVTVTGWFRRGVTPWIDIESLRSQGGKVTRANYPLWLTILALAAAFWGAYLIWQA